MTRASAASASQPGHPVAFGCGNRACRRKVPCRAPASRVPPSRLARSRIPTMPWPPPGAEPFTVGLVTVISTASGAYHNRHASAAAPVAYRVGQRLLQDAVRRPGDGGRQAPVLAAHVGGEDQTAAAVVLQQLVEGGG